MLQLLILSMVYPIMHAKENEIKELNESGNY